MVTAQKPLAMTEEQWREILVEIAELNEKANHLVSCLEQLAIKIEKIAPKEWDERYIHDLEDSMVEEHH